NLRRLLKTLVADLYVLERRDAVVGVVAVTYRRSLAHGGLVATIDLLRVRPASATACAEDEAAPPVRLAPGAAPRPGRGAAAAPRLRRDRGAARRSGGGASARARRSDRGCGAAGALATKLGSRRSRDERRALTRRSMTRFTIGLLLGLLLGIGGAVAFLITAG